MVSRNKQVSPKRQGFRALPLIGQRPILPIALSQVPGETIKPSNNVEQQYTGEESTHHALANTGVLYSGGREEAKGREDGVLLTKTRLYLQENISPKKKTPVLACQ